MKIELGIQEGNRQQEFLDYLNSALRQRMPIASGSSTRQEDGCFVSILKGPFKLNEIFVPLSWSLTRSPDNKILQSIEVEAGEGEPPDFNWRSTVQEFIDSILIATIASKRTTYFRRSFFYYVGEQMDGEYWLPGFRLAPVNPEDNQPFLINAERIVSIDMDIEAVDKMHAIALAEEASRRHAARLSLLLNHGLYKQDNCLRWGIPVDNSGNIGSSVRYYPAYEPIPVLDRMPPKGITCPLGKYEGSLTARSPSSGKMLSLPREIRKILRNIEKSKPELRTAFDNGARLYQLGAIIGLHFPSAELAYRMAAIDAMSRSCGSKRQIESFIKKYASEWPDLEQLIGYLWGSIRSAHFHGGVFPFGEFFDMRFMDLLPDSCAMEMITNRSNCYQLTREVIGNWICQELSSEEIEDE